MVDLRKVWASRLSPTKPQDETTLRLAASFLEPTSPVYDLGSGWRAFSGMHRNVVSVDFVAQFYPDVVADLRIHDLTPAPGVLMRHVLEHSEEWRDMLTKAVASFTHRMMLIVHTPDADEQEILINRRGLVDIALPTDEVGEFFTGMRVNTYTLITPTEYRHERVWEVMKW